LRKKKRETKSVKKLEALKDLLGGVFGLHSLGESESLFFLIWTENILTILSENFICKQARGSKNGKRSELRKSQRRKPKRTPKTP
jgi:hypothetical protein